MIVVLGYINTTDLKDEFKVMLARADKLSWANISFDIWDGWTGLKQNFTLQLPISLSAGSFLIIDSSFSVNEWLKSPVKGYCRNMSV